MMTVFFNIAACPLCIVQRVLYLLVSLISLFGLVAAEKALCRVASALSIAVVAASGAAVAGYQIYLQRNPFTATCGDGTAWWERLVDQAGQLLPMLFKADGLCSEDTGSILGLTIPEWSLLAFCGLFVLGLLALLLRQRR